jgi:hypothetical protein
MKRLDQDLLDHPETNKSRPGILLGPHASQASAVAKSYSNQLRTYAVAFLKLPYTWLPQCEALIHSARSESSNVGSLG